MERSRPANSREKRFCHTHCVLEHAFCRAADRRTYAAPSGFPFVIGTIFGSRPFGAMSYPSEEDMKSIVSKVQRFLKSEDGPTAVEYAIMLALIVIVCLTAIQAVGTNASAAFNDIANDLNAARTGTVN